MHRFSIRTLMAVVLISAVGLAALTNANDLWAGLTMLGAMAATGAAVLGAFILRGRERCWCAGFAFFSTGYLMLVVGPWLGDSFQPRRTATQAIRYGYERISPAAYLQAAMIKEARMSGMRPFPVPVGPMFDQFQCVAHSLFALLAGLTGATVAAWFHARRVRSEADTGQQ
jgi:hypothetical protein